MSTCLGCEGIGFHSYNYPMDRKIQTRDGSYCVLRLIYEGDGPERSVSVLDSFTKVTDICKET